MLYQYQRKNEGGKLGYFSIGTIVPSLMEYAGILTGVFAVAKDEKDIALATLGSGIYVLGRVSRNLAERKIDNQIANTLENHLKEK